MNKLSSFVSQVSADKVRVAFFALTVILFVVGAGAPAAGTGIIH